MQLENKPPKPRILVADDDAVTRSLICSTARSEGYEVVVAEDGREALRTLDTDSNFKGAIVDTMLPHIEGIDVVRHMKTEKRFMRIPVLMTTSERDIQLVGKTLAAGAMLFLPKPFSHMQLKSMLKMLVSQSVDHNLPAYSS